MHYSNALLLTLASSNPRRRPILLTVTVRLSVLIPAHHMTTLFKFTELLVQGCCCFSELLGKIQSRGRHPPCAPIRDDHGMTHRLPRTFGNGRIADFSSLSAPKYAGGVGCQGTFQG
jgi:hypothetical protein